MKGYSFKEYNKENMARALGSALPISFKQSVEICSFIKNRSAADAKKILGNVVEKKSAIPFTRFNFDLSHKKKIGPGRYPEKASKEFIRLIEDVEANAQFKGMNTSKLVISHISAHKASKSWHYGRKTRRKMKRTNVEIVVVEDRKSDKKSSDKKPVDETKKEK